MDIFEEYLQKPDHERVKQALTDKSFNAYRCRNIKQNNPDHTDLNTPLNTNFNMATLGDAILKFILIEQLWDKEDDPTEAKAQLESDRVLVEVIGKHYKILNHLQYDYDDKKLPKDYEYRSAKGKNKNPHKYIATCVEAMIATVYLDSPTENLDKLRGLILGHWIPMIRKQKSYQNKK